jgi:hypothetical protein
MRDASQIAGSSRAALRRRAIDRCRRGIRTVTLGRDRRTAVVVGAVASTDVGT